jgi:hypothetical protein
VALLAIEPVARRHRIERVRAAVRVDQPRQPHRAQRGGAPRNAQPRELGLQETVVEARVVGHEHGVAQPLQQLVGQLGEAGRVAHHGVGDAGQPLDLRRDRPLRIDQARPLLHAHGAAIEVHADDAHLGDALARRRGAGSLQVHEHAAAVHQRGQRLQAGRGGSMRGEGGGGHGNQR